MKCIYIYHTIRKYIHIITTSLYEHHFLLLPSQLLLLHGGPCRFGCDLAQRGARHHGSKIAALPIGHAAEKTERGPDCVGLELDCCPLQWKTGWWQLKDFFGFFSPRKFGEDDSQFDVLHIFRRGWFNHQPVRIVKSSFFSHFKHL